MRNIILITCALMLLGCSKPNSKPTYGETGLPKNCRAIIQNAIDEWKKGSYSTDDIINSIERNCGKDGYSWEYN